MLSIYAIFDSDALNWGKIPEPKVLPLITLVILLNVADMLSPSYEFPSSKYVNVPPLAKVVPLAPPLVDPNKKSKEPARPPTTEEVPPDKLLLTIRSFPVAVTV